MLSTREGAKMDNGVEIRKKKKKGLPKGWRREEKKKIKEMERDISCVCVCVWCLSMCKKI